jgi:2-succinyl-5-enolpyruvyl-6-hydroxy-3-cyclohexene-1-carboxylate synthase
VSTDRPSPGKAQQSAPAPGAGAGRSARAPESALAHQLLGAFAQELVRCGMELAVTAPGSRNTPLLLALAAQEQLACVSQIDERTAGFFALGAAKASGLPVAVTCTSGTAAAQLYPAVIEAREASVPLLVLSADRPAELRECGAGQAIDQIKLYGGAVKWFFEVELPGAVEEGAIAKAHAFARTLACRAYWRALEGRPGPVHLNFPLREPLVPAADLPPAGGARPGNRPRLRRVQARVHSEDALAELSALLAGARRPVLVAGRREGTPAARSAYARALCTLAEEASVPLLADPLSGARRGAAAIAHYDALLRYAPLAERLTPDLVIRVGALPTSKPLRSWLARLQEANHVALDPIGDHQDPDGVLALSLALEPAIALPALADEHKLKRAAPEALSASLEAYRREWLERWRAGDERAAAALAGQLDGQRCSELQIAAELGVLLPSEATLFVSSSMPVRDIETMFPVRADPPAVLCNRGANGIDGVLASACGAAAIAREQDGPVVVLIGDVALAHDSGCLVMLSRSRQKVVIVLINNGGGAIFDFLAVARADAARVIYEPQIATPPQVDFGALASAAGIDHLQPQTIPELRHALERALAAPRSTLIEVRSERARNRLLHEQAFAAVAAELSAL